MAKKRSAQGNRAIKRRKAPRELKQDLIQIRVTAEQRGELKEAADRAGLDLSPWMRMVALKAANDQKQ
jgi:uncharacterized protein (DUF1778 family)